MPDIRQIFILMAGTVLSIFATFHVTLAQNMPSQETDSIITLQTVLITAPRQELFSAGFHQEVIRKEILERYAFLGLDQLFSRQTGSFIKAYGPGMLATSSMRGGSASHTSMLWNGFNLHSPMSGQLDLSLLPASFFDQVTLQYGGGSALWGSGAMGGAIFLDNSQQTTDGISTQLALGSGNLGERSQAARISFANKSFSSHLRLIHAENDNHYRYVNTSLPHHPIETQTNAGLTQKGLLSQNTWQIKPRHQLQWHLWWQENDRHIPPALQQSHTGASQQDKAGRITANWQSAWKEVVVNWKAALFDESIRYTDSVSITTLNKWQTLAQETDISWQPFASLLINSGFQTRQLTASSDEYADTHQQRSLAGFFSGKWDSPEQNLHLMVNLRQEYIPGQSIPLVPSFGLAWKVNHDVSIKLNAGKNYRLPSLNDLYWVPGGNPDLKPESGWSQDLVFIYYHGRNKQKSSQLLNNYNPLENISLSLFNRYVNNWIIWLPKGGGMLWSPENIMEVHSRGLELRISGSMHQHQMVFRYKFNYDFVRATNRKARSPNDRSVGKQLIYVPEHRAGINLSLGWKALSLFYDHQYTSRIYTSSDNSYALPPGQYADLSLQWQKPYNKWQASFFVSMANVWNEQWMVMPGRPMPLRYFRAGLSIGYKTND
jgi:vitamin B12 transporter